MYFYSRECIFLCVLVFIGSTARSAILVSYRRDKSFLTVRTDGLSYLVKATGRDRQVGRARARTRMSLSFTVDRPRGSSPRRSAAVDRVALFTLNCNCPQLVTGPNKRGGRDREGRSGRLSSRSVTVAIPKGRPGEERVAGEETGPVEVVTASGEHQNPENRHARYPGGRHHCHATLPHVILCQHRQKTIILSHQDAKPVMGLVTCGEVTCMHAYRQMSVLRVFLLDSAGSLFAHVPHFAGISRGLFAHTITICRFYWQPGSGGRRESGARYTAKHLLMPR